MNGMSLSLSRRTRPAVLMDTEESPNATTSMPSANVSNTFGADESSTDGSEATANNANISSWSNRITSNSINGSWSMPSFTHDFTDCCRSSNVSHKCMRYCTVYTLFNRSGNYPDASDLCVEDYASIVKCSAGGRNHVRCCQRENIPEMCQVNRIMFVTFGSGGSGCRVRFGERFFRHFAAHTPSRCGALCSLARAFRIRSLYFGTKEHIRATPLHWAPFFPLLRSALFLFRSPLRLFALFVSIARANVTNQNNNNKNSKNGWTNLNQ